MPNAQAEAAKAEGNNFFKGGQYTQAVNKYSEAIQFDPTNHTYYSNRSASYANLGEWKESADDARECIRIDKNFIKGYFRLATAQKNLNEVDGAINTLKSGLGIEPRNADLKGLLKEMEEIQRTEKVSNFIISAQEQFKCGDFANAMKSVENGMRLDAGNAQLTKLANQIRPKFEQSEQMRKKGLNRIELLKENGDEAYKNAQFEVAIVKYGECLNLIGDKTSQLALKCYSNRAACYKQLSNFEGVIEDSTAVLEAEPNNVKALVRRAQAFEGMERYRSALQDVRFVLQMPQNEVGAVNWKLANDMQHRLTRAVNQLKQGNF